MPKSPELLPLHRPEETLPPTPGRAELVEARPTLPQTGYSPLPPALTKGPDMTSLLRALGRRWLLASFLGILAAGGVAAAVWFFLPIRYTAYSQLRVAMTPPWLVVRNADTSEGRGEFSAYQRTQAAWIKNYSILGLALEREDVIHLKMVREQPERLTWLMEELKVDFQEGSEIMTVSMIGNDPSEVVKLVQAVTDVYIKTIVDKERENRKDRLVELNKIYETSVGKLRRQRNAQRRLAEDLGTSDSQALTQKQVNLLALFGEKQRQHDQVKTELMKTQARLESYQAREKAVVNEPTLSPTLLNEVLEADLTGKQLLLRVNQLQDLVSEYQHSALRDDEPSLKKAQSMLEETKKSLDVRREELRPSVLERLKQKNQNDHQADLAQLQSEMAMLIKQEKELGEYVERLRKEADKVGTSSTELEMLRAEVQRDDKVATRVSDELDVLNIELRSPPRVTLNQEAAIQKKDVKRFLLALILGPLVALVGVCLAIAWLEFRRRRIQNSNEVIHGLGMRVVGAVPALPQRVRSKPNAANQTAAGNTLIESVDGIRTVLLRDASVQETRIVMVTSAVSGEGKTTLASHLAGSLARSGRRTLLIDCDLRHPAVHQLFELPLSPGFSEAVLGEMHVVEVIRPTTIKGLSVITAGQWDREVMQIMTREEVVGIFEKLKAEYEFIVMDSHPILAATDGLVIGQYADAVLLSLLRDVSQTPRVYAACQRLATLGIRVLGAVVNGTRRDDPLGSCGPLVQPPVRAA